MDEAKPKLMLVEWEDARKEGGPWTRLDLQQAKTLRALTVGWGIERDGKVVLAQEYWPDDDSYEQEETYRSILVIPRQMVRSVKYLEEEGKGEGAE